MNTLPRETGFSRSAGGAAGGGPLIAWPLRVYWEDTDAGGVVYHARYLHFLERARTEWLRAAGIGQQDLREREGIVFVVQRIEIAFNAPARLDDALVATVAAAQRRSASLLVRQQLLREPSPQPLVEAGVRVACVDAATFRPRRIPDHLFRETANP